MMEVMAQSSQFEAWQRAVRNQFQYGGSWTSVFVVLLSLAALVVLVGWLSRIQNRSQQRTENAPRNSDPQRLYAHLLSNLGLNVPQRQLLESVARDLRLPHPTTLLVSETLYDQCVEQWTRRAGGAAAEADRATTLQIFTRTRNRLFPEGTGMVFSTPTR
ncbi:MAG: hypothetical protein Q7R41_19500 [Phycisphaerales bacterium]|nr:hypothetical protein [Phycisphaerales bacterium]